MTDEISVWPFARKQKSAPVPSIRCEGIEITWDPRFGCWEFASGGIDYSLCENARLDTSLLSKLPLVAEWLAKLDAQIDAEVKQHLEGWCEWTGAKDLVGIDVSWLADRCEIDVSYACDDWGDLGVNVVIRDGRIAESYAGD